MTHLKIQYPKITFTSIIINLIRKAWKYQQSSQVGNLSSAVNAFLKVTDSLCSFLWKCLPNAQVWTTIVYPTFFLLKNDVSCRKKKKNWLVQLMTQSHKWFLQAKTLIQCVQQKHCPYISHFITQNIKITHIQGLNWWN